MSVTIARTRHGLRHFERGEAIQNHPAAQLGLLFRKSSSQ
jgi:hypothetical protein